MKHSWLTNGLIKIIDYLAQVESPSAFRFPLRVTVSIFSLLETNPRVWMRFGTRWAFITSVMVLIVGIVFPASFRPDQNIPFIIQIGFPLVFVFFPSLSCFKAIEKSL